jgi:hypothetical protein
LPATRIFWPDIGILQPATGRLWSVNGIYCMGQIKEYLTSYMDIMTSFWYLCYLQEYLGQIQEYLAGYRNISASYMNI